jgi:uncharacterized membrane protein YdjX (TVP38/TMEM64 family)
MRLVGPLIRAVLWLIAAVILAVTRVSPALHHEWLVLSSGLTIGHLRAYVARWGPWAPGVSMLIMVIQTFLPFPSDPLIMANGAIFGFWGGLGVSVTGALLSGCLAFGLGRRVGHSTAARIVPRSWVEWVDRSSRGGGWLSVLVLQAVPAIPFSILNFVLGMTPVSWVIFVWTLGVAVLPPDVVLVALGRGVAEEHAAVYWTLGAVALLTVASIPARRWLVRKWQAPVPPPARRKTRHGAGRP